MERIFHPGYLGPPAEIANDAPVQLKRQHLWLNAEIAADAFAGERQVYVVYYPQRGAVLLAPMSDDAFKSLHECSLIMLKDRNVCGDKSLSLQEIIIDHDLDATDRVLEFTTQPGLQMLQVKLAADGR